MTMKRKLHCKQRQQQRGRADADISIIGKYGEHHRGVCLLTRRRVKSVVRRLRRWMVRHTSSRVRKRANQVRAIIARLEKLADWMLVVSANGEVITVYRADRQRQRKFMRGKCRPVDGFSGGNEI